MGRTEKEIDQLLGRSLLWIVAIASVVVGFIK